MAAQTVGISKRAIVLAILAAGLIGLLVATNPTMEQYQEYVPQTLVQES